MQDSDTAKVGHPTRLAPFQLLDLAQTRWREIEANQPELAPAIALQRPLIARTIQTVNSLTNEEPVLHLSVTDLQEKLLAGIPILRGESVTLPVSLLGPLIGKACNDLAGGEAGGAAHRVRHCLEAGRVDTSSLLSASFERNEVAIRAKAMQEGIAPDVLWLAAELAVGPVAHVTARTLFAMDGIRAHDIWPHGYCPACGSWPAFGEELGGTNQLRCSFCGLAWPKLAAGCNYCGESSKITTAKANSNSTYTVELCADCGAYLKLIGVSAPTPFELLPVEDLASASVDVLAAQQGFGRPSLPNLGLPGRLPCDGIQPEP